MTAAALSGTSVGPVEIDNVPPLYAPVVLPAGYVVANWKETGVTSKQWMYEVDEKSVKETYWIRLHCCQN